MLDCKGVGVFESDKERKRVRNLLKIKGLSGDGVVDSHESFWKAEKQKADLPQRHRDTEKRRDTVSRRGPKR